MEFIRSKYDLNSDWKFKSFIAGVLAFDHFNFHIITLVVL